MNFLPLMSDILLKNQKKKLDNSPCCFVVLCWKTACFDYKTISIGPGSWYLNKLMQKSNNNKTNSYHFGNSEEGESLHKKSLRDSGFRE